MVATLFFAFHPIQVESVAWIAQRKGLLACCYLLLTANYYIQYVKAPKRTLYAAMLFTYICALLAKPIAVTFSIILVVLDRWFFQRTALREKLPLFTVAFAIGVLNIGAEFKANTLQSFVVTEVPVLIRILNSLSIFLDYFVNLLLPRNLAMFYPYPDSGWGSRQHGSEE